MKILNTLVLLLVLSSIANAKCRINTDIDFEINTTESGNVWKFLTEQPGCRSTKMNLGDYWNGKNDIEIIAFNYQIRGRFGMAKSTLGICRRDVITSQVHCDEDVDIVNP